MCRGVAVAVGALSFLTCNLKRWTLQISWRSLMRWWWQHSEEVWLRILRRGCWSVPTSCTSVVSQTTNAGTILKPCGLSYVCWWVLQDEISITQFAELSLRVLIWNRFTKIDGHSFSLEINPPKGGPGGVAMAPNDRWIPRLKASAAFKMRRFRTWKTRARWQLDGWDSYDIENTLERRFSQIFVRWNHFQKKVQDERSHET